MWSISYVNKKNLINILVFPLFLVYLLIYYLSVISQISTGYNKVDNYNYLLRIYCVLNVYIQTKRVCGVYHIDEKTPQKRMLFLKQTYTIIIYIRYIYIYIHLRSHLPKYCIKLFLTVVDNNGQCLYFVSQSAVVRISLLKTFAHAHNSFNNVFIWRSC